MMSVTKGLKIRLYPDEDMKKAIEQNIGNARFTWNQLLTMYTETYQLFKSHGYTRLQCNLSTFNSMLNMLKTEYSFLYLSESTSLQQVFRDLLQTFNKFFKEGAGYPRRKTKRNPKQSFRIQNNKKSNSIHVDGKHLYLPKLGGISFRTSPEYMKLLKECTINNVTICRENGLYFAVVNVETVHVPVESYGGDAVGIDLGLKNLATLSTGLKIVNLDLSKEEERINFYQRQMSRRQRGSRGYQVAQRKYWKWVNRKKNRKNDAYHRFTHYIISYFGTVCMETLNIKGMFQNDKWSPKLQRNGLYEIVRQLQYKCDWNNRDFIQVNWFFPSSQLCSNCGYQHHDLGIGVGKWTCPECKSFHDRDINAAVNIRDEGLRLLKKKNKKK